MTEALFQKLEEAFKIDATDEEACSYAGIAEATYYDHLKNEPLSSERMRRAQRFPFIAMKKVVVKESGDGNLALKWLSRRQRDRYFEKQAEEIGDRVRVRLEMFTLPSIRLDRSSSRRRCSSACSGAASWRHLRGAMQTAIDVIPP